MVKILPSRAGGVGLVLGRGAEISWPQNKNINQKQYTNKFNEDFKNGPHKKSLKKNLRKLVAKGVFFA